MTKPIELVKEKSINFNDLSEIPGFLKLVFEYNVYYLEISEIKLIGVSKNGKVQIIDRNCDEYIPLNTFEDIVEQMNNETENDIEFEPEFELE